jgi:branched-chain amino acid transport system substrate-binding protein
VLLALTALAALVTLPAALGGSQATPGITNKLIVIGGTFPFTGPASSYAPIPRGMTAFFSYVNATKGPDGKKGVGGRQILFKSYDDAYNPATTVDQTRRLVESDKVFALVGGLGTEPQLAVRDYLNQKQVPQLYVSTGATTFDADSAKYPWTLGWQPDYQAEGAIYGKQIAKNDPNAKIAIIEQNDDYGHDYHAGLASGLGSHKNQIVLTRGFNVADPSVASQLVDLRRTGADTLVIFATPAKTIQTYATLPRIGWKPDKIYLNSVSATDAFMTTAVRLAGADAVNGSISVQYLKDPAQREWANDKGMKLYKSIGDKFLPSDANVNDSLYLYGMAKAWDFVELMRKLGKNPTRAGLMKLARHLTIKDNPFALPGVTTSTSGKDQFPIQQERLIRFSNGTWNAIGPVINGRGK